MVGILISWVTIAAGLWLSDKVLDGFKIRGGIGSFLLVAALFGVLNFLLGWFIYAVLGVLSLGLGFLFGFVTRLVVSALLLKLADAFSSRLEIRGFKYAFLAALVMAIASLAVDWAIRT